MNDTVVSDIQPLTELSGLQSLKLRNTEIPKYQRLSGFEPAALFEPREYKSQKYHSIIQDDRN